MGVEEELALFQKLISCPICIDTLHDPVSATCDHIFCRNCLVEALKHKPTCPLCNLKTSARAIRPILYLSSIVGRFEDLLAAFQAERTAPACSDRLQLPSVSVAYSFPSSSTLEADTLSNSVATCATHSSSSSASFSAISCRPPSSNPISTTPTQSTTISVPLQSAAHRLVTNVAEPSAAPVKLEDIPFAQGTLVNVLPRTWAGINKLGGVGRIEALQSESSGFMYTVKYVLDGNRDENVPAAFVELYEELGRTGRRSRQSVDSRESDPDTEPYKRKIHRISSSSSSSSAYMEDRGKTCSTASSVEQGVPETTHPSPSSLQPIVLLTTAIDSSSFPSFPFDRKLEAFSAMRELVSLKCSFSDEVTHLVVSTDRNNIMQQRTMKYMQALSRGIWIVSTKWIEDSIAAGKILQESKYEVRGNVKAYEEQAPRRARIFRSQCHLNTRPGLLPAFKVLLFGAFPLPGPARSDLEYLLTQCQARIFSSISSFITDAAGLPHDDGNAQYVVVITSNKESSSQTQIQEELSMVEQRWVAKRKISVVSSVWVMDTITNFAVIPLEQYEL